MLYAVIRSRNEALHFIAELNPYNLETLRDYARGTSRECGSTDLKIAVPAADQKTLRRYTRGWRSRLNKAGVSVSIECADDGIADADVPATAVNGTPPSPATGG